MALADAKKQKHSSEKRTAPAEGNGHVFDAALADALEPLLEALFLEGHTHIAAASPSNVAKLVSQLERLLVVNGIVPQSKRAQDPQAYARHLQRAEDEACRKEFKARCAEAQRNAASFHTQRSHAESNSIADPLFSSSK